MSSGRFWEAIASAECEILGAEYPTKGRLLWGVAPTGTPHFGYATSLLVARTAAVCGFETTCLIADYHAYLDDRKSGWNELAVRGSAYADALSPSFQETIYAHNAYVDRLYFEGLMRFSEEVLLADAVESGEGTLRRNREERRVSEVLYTIMQMYDLLHFGVAVAVCGADESPIYRCAHRILHTLNEKSPVFIFVPLCPGIETTEMHASSPGSNKIPLDASELRVAGLVRSASAEQCGLLAEHVRAVLRPLASAANMPVLQRECATRRLEDEVSELLAFLRDGTRHST